MLGPPGWARPCSPSGCRRSCRRSRLKSRLKRRHLQRALGRLPAGQPLMAIRHARRIVQQRCRIGRRSSPPSPGEISLAHHGVLFSTSCPSSIAALMEVVGEAVESASSRSRGPAEHNLPGGFYPGGCVNPCPCGFRTDPRRNCSCSPLQVEKYIEPHFRSAARQNRHPHRSPGCALPRISITMPARAARRCQKKS